MCRWILQRWYSWRTHRPARWPWVRGKSSQVSPTLKRSTVSTFILIHGRGIIWLTFISILSLIWRISLSMDLFVNYFPHITVWAFGFRDFLSHHWIPFPSITSSSSRPHFTFHSLEGRVRKPKSRTLSARGVPLVRFPNCIVYQSGGWGPWLVYNPDKQNVQW